MPPPSAPRGANWLTHGALRRLWLDVRRSLHGYGPDASDRVAIVLPNGAEVTTAFPAVAQAAKTAPLYPAFTRTELDFFPTDLRARALIVAAGLAGGGRFSVLHARL